jgi:hypothetical protein
MLKKRILIESCNVGDIVWNNQYEQYQIIKIEKTLVIFKDLSTNKFHKTVKYVTYVYKELSSNQ